MGRWLLKGPALTNAQNLTKKKKDDESRAECAERDGARIIAQRTGIPYEQALGTVQSGNAPAGVGDDLHEADAAACHARKPGWHEAPRVGHPRQPGGTGIGGGAVPRRCASPGRNSASRTASADGRTPTLADGTPVKFPGGNFQMSGATQSRKRIQGDDGRPKAFDTLNLRTMPLLG